uniref:Uncharacterized protein n=1 Tax=Lepeophtheirus salmonis TaxID=72036 RepID=A0A0K2SXL2_LEPSM
MMTYSSDMGIHFYTIEAFTSTVFLWETAQVLASMKSQIP